MAKYQMEGSKVFGADGSRVNFNETREALRDFNLEAKWNSKAHGHVDSMQFRDVADGVDYHVLAKRYKVGPSAFVIIGKVEAETYMVTQGTFTDWDGRYAIKVNQEQLDKLFK